MSYTLWKTSLLEFLFVDFQWINQSTAVNQSAIQPTSQLERALVRQ